MNYQWYPGHMTKAKRQMQEDIKLIDLVIELVDARIPLASRNPDIDQLGQNKFRLIIINKADLVDEKDSNRYLRYFEEKGFYAVKLDSRSKNGMKNVSAAIDQVCQAKFERDRKRGIVNRPVRAMIVGIPNVGKSTFINSFAGKAVAKTGNKPGVTKGKQWIRLNKNVELLDTPGILWPKFDDQKVGQYLAFIGSMNDEILQIGELAMDFIGLLMERYPGLLEARYQFQEEDLAEGVFPGKTKEARVLYAIAKNRNFLIKDGEYDFEKAAATVMNEFRSGALGKICLE
ncbi:MAG: ribosome biogenesis GTPase YlqF [Lachnospiraceae bacterium]|nr:ribosome biogenesis GTPase YlqF [Lachnospiraceae bacterium]